MPFGAAAYRHLWGHLAGWHVGAGIQIPILMFILQGLLTFESSLATCFIFLKADSHVAQAGLLFLTLCLHIPGSRITDPCYHAVL